MSSSNFLFGFGSVFYGWRKQVDKNFEGSVRRKTKDVRQIESQKQQLDPLSRAKMFSKRFSYKTKLRRMR